MKGIHFLGSGRISIDEIPTPEPNGREVLIRMKSASICGTDRENLMGAGQSTVPGHENAGEVVAVDKPSWVKVGDRVAINCHITCGHCEHCLNGDLYFCDQLTVVGFDRNGGYADYVLVPEASCMALPNDISYEEGSLLVDMLGTPFRAVKRAELVPGDKITVWGAGPIGLGLVMVAMRIGAEVAVVDLSDHRLNLARTFGPAFVLNPARDPVDQILKEWTHGKGIDAGFDCVGSEKVCLQALSVLKKRGKLVIVGVSHKLTLDPWEHFTCREFTLIGTRNFNTRDFDQMIGLLRTGLPLLQVVTHRFQLLQAEEAFATFREGECGKILIVD